MTIKVIDLFAGCGGIGEGFSAFAINDQRKFDVVLSVESDKQACDTLMLRKFFWEFDEVPDDYYQYIKGLLSKEDLKACGGDPMALQRLVNAANDAPKPDGPGSFENAVQGVQDSLSEY